MNRATKKYLLTSTGLPPWAMQVPGIGFDADFVNARAWQQGIGQGSLNQFLTCSRASSGTAADTNGNYTTFGANVLRVTNQGLLVEEARTNSIRNNTMQGAVVGQIGAGGSFPTNWSFSNIGGLTGSILATGTVNGINFIQFGLVGTLSSGTIGVIQFENTSAIPASYGQTWSQSLWLQYSNTTNIGNIILQTIGTGGGEIDNTVTPTTTLIRYQGSATLIGAGTTAVQPSIKLFGANGQVVNTVLTISWPQLELNSLINSSVASAVVAAGGTVTGVSRTMGVFGGTGTPATVAATIAATAVTAISSIPAAGSYTTLAPSPAPIGDWIGNASISGTTLTINSTAFGTFAIGQTVGGGTVSAATTVLSGSGSTWTVSNSQTVTSTNLYSFAGTTVPTVTLTPTNNAAQGFATSPIPTTNAAVARNADVVTLATAPTFSGSYSIYSSGTPETPTAYATNQRIAEMDGGSGSNLFSLLRVSTSGNANTQMLVAGSGVSSPSTSTAWGQNIADKFAAALAPGNQNISFAGATAVNTTTTPIFTPSRVFIGVNGGFGNQFWNGYIKGIALWPSTALSAAQLQAITAPGYPHP